MITQYIDQLLFLNTETTREFQDFGCLPELWKELWTNKANTLHRRVNMGKEESFSSEELYNKQAGLYAEFGKVICISIGLISVEEGISYINYKSFSHPNERLLLLAFANFLASNPKISCVAGHSIKEFDIPFLARRYCKHMLSIPTLIDVRNKKPWELKHVHDTMELWRFGDYKKFISLRLLSALYNIDTVEEDIDGSKIGHLYWMQKDMDRIQNYCASGIKNVVQLYCKLKLIRLGFLRSPASSTTQEQMLI